MGKEDSTCPACGSGNAYIPLFSGNIKCINPNCVHFSPEHRRDELGLEDLPEVELNKPDVIDCDWEPEITPILWSSPSGLPKGIVNKLSTSINLPMDIITSKLCLGCTNYAPHDESWGICSLKALAKSPKDSCQEWHGDIAFPWFGPAKNKKKE